MEATKQREMQWRELLEQALSGPGTLSACYSAFHSYSLGNQVAAWFQCKARGIEPGPLATYPAWKAKGRQVKRGERALVLCQPVTCKRTERNEETGEETEHGFTRFTWRPSWFTVAQTEPIPGAEQTPEVQLSDRVWDKARALTGLEIAEVCFESLDGNCQGYAKGRTIAINPIAALPHKTTFHELAHVLLHTGEHADNETMPRTVAECEAEGVAYLLCSALELPGLAEARGYLKHWGGEISETSARRIFSAADKILRAGQEGGDQ